MAWYRAFEDGDGMLLLLRQTLRLMGLVQQCFSLAGRKFWWISSHLQHPHRIFVQLVAVTSDRPFRKYKLFGVSLRRTVRISVGPHARRESVQIESDNSSTVSFLNRGTTCSATALLWVRLLFYSSLQFDSRVLVQHNLGTLNSAADALSRLSTDEDRWGRFQRVFHVSTPVISQSDLFSSNPYPQSGTSLIEFAKVRHCCLFPANPQNLVEKVPEVRQ